MFRHVPLDRLPLVTTTTLWLQGEGSPIDSDASAAIAAMRAGVLMPVASLADRAAAIMQMLR